MTLLRITFILWSIFFFCNEGWCNKEDSFYYLPKNVKPMRYNFTLEPLIDNKTVPQFVGSITIDLKATEDTNYITFHIKDLTIEEETIEVTDFNGNNVLVSKTNFNETIEIYTIYLENKLEENKNYKLKIGKYFGLLNHEKSGFFYASYLDHNNTLRYMVVTEFEPMAARTAFPCFDEPALKATFIVNLIRLDGYISVSNEQLLKTINLGNGRFMDVFKETVLMPTYLVAFSISQYKYTEKNGKIRIFTRPEAIKGGFADFILENSIKLLTAMEDYTGINYTLDKLDLLTVPGEYFVDGAMENWGLIIYREIHLLYSKKISTLTDMQRCMTYTAHEFAHQWFGNLVTPKKWNYMWLSEGFAAYFQYYLAAIVEPSWKLTEQYVIEDYQTALRNDIYTYTEPVNFIFTPDSKFPSPIIYYYKASALIRMSQHFLTEKVFRNGLRLYLSKHKFRATEPEDVYRALQEALDQENAGYLLGNLSVSEVLDSWFSNKGFPLITVTRNYKTGSITFAQEIYLNEDDSTDINQIWKIPINYVLHNKDPLDFSKTVSDLWLVEQNVTIDGSTDDNWILINKQQTGYYRAYYDLVNWKNVINFLQNEDFELIHPINRAQLIEDAFYFAENGKLDYELALNLTTYLWRETDYIPLKSFSNIVGNLNAVLSLTETSDLFHIYAKNILNKTYNRLGLEEKNDDTHLNKLIRSMITNWMCKFGDSQCKNFGLEKVKQWRKTGSQSIPSDLQYQLLCGAMQIATYEDWEFVLQKFYTAKYMDSRIRYLKSLSCSQNSTVLNRLMDIIYDPESPMSTQEKFTAANSVASSSVLGLDLTLDYALQNAANINMSWTDTPSNIDAVFVSNKFLPKIKALIEAGTLKNVPLTMYLESALTKAEIASQSRIANWLLEYNKLNVEKYNVV